MVKTYWYKDFEVTIELHNYKKSDTIYAWDVRIGKCQLDYCTTASGQLILGMISPDATNTDTTVLLEPCAISHGDLIPISSGAGCWAEFVDNYLVARESVPFEYIRPYIDHIIAMHELHSKEAVLEHLEESMTSVT